MLSEKITQPEVIEEVQEELETEEVEVPEIEETSETAEDGEDIPESEPEEVVEEKFKLKHNHEEKDYPKEEAIRLAQKGLNYDKVYKQLETLKNDKRLSFVDNLAKKNNMTVEKYLDAVKQQEVSDEIERIADERNVPLDVAKDLYDNLKLKTITKEKELTQKQVDKENSDLSEFVKSYPDIKGEKIPSEVWTDWNKGKNKTLIDAYVKHENKLLKDELSKLKEVKKIDDKNIENTNKSTGSLKSKGVSDGELYTRTQVEAMSREEISNNYDKVMKSYKSWK